MTHCRLVIREGTAMPETAFDITPAAQQLNARAQASFLVRF